MLLQQPNLSIFEEHESEVRSYCRSFPIVLNRAKDSEIFDVNNKRYIDFFSGAGAINYGHNNHEIKEAVLNYMARDGIMMSLDFHTKAKEKFIQTFQEKLLKPRNLKYKMQFTSPSGTSVVESAIKLARKVTGRQNVIAFTNAFHGMSGTSLSLTGNDHHRQEVSYSMVSRFPYDGYMGMDFDYLAHYTKLIEDPSSGVDLPAAIILEVVQGEGGLNVCRTEWLQGLKQLCEKHEILLIVDDIQAGCGRSGKFFSFEHHDVQPDIVCLSKSIGGLGLPCAVLLFSPELDIWNKGEDNGTFRGNNLAFVAAHKMIDLYWSDSAFEQTLTKKTNLISRFCEKIQLNHIQHIPFIKGIGLMQGLEFNDSRDAAAVVAECFKNGVIIETCGSLDQIVKIMPALTISNELLEEGLCTLERCVQTALTDSHLSNVSSVSSMTSI